MDTTGIGKEHDHKRHQNGYRIHVDRGAQRDNNTGDFIGNAKIFFHAGFTDWYRRRTGAGTKGI